MVDQIVVQHSRTRLIWLFLGAAMFVALGCFLVSGAAGERADAPIVGWACILFFGVCGVYAASRLFWRTPALVISAQGVVDRASAASVGLVKWSQIEDMKILSFRGQRFLAIFVTDPAAVIARHTLVKRGWLQANFALAGTPVTIPGVSLSMSLEDLDALIRSKWLAEKGNHPRS